MTTLAIMKDRVAREVRRKAYADVGSVFQDHIDNAINTAIQQYQAERFHFNESRATTFPTVANQEFYDSDDEADLAVLVKIDYVKLIVGDTNYTLLPDYPSDIESASTNATATGQPGWYIWYGNQLRLYPIPAESAWTVRIAGVFKYAAPAADATTGNFWMTDAELLIRSRAKYELALHVLRDTLLAQEMGASVLEALSQLKRFTNKLTTGYNGRVLPMSY